MVKVVREHFNGFDLFRNFDFEGDLSFEKDYSYPFKKARGTVKPLCFHIKSDNEGKKHQLANSYFIGVDWIVKNKCALYVEPKLNEISEEQTDFVYMLFSILKHPELYPYLDELYEVRWEDDQISMNSLNDHLTPLLIVQFLQVVQRIARKGLKKSYYKVESNLLGKVKGKVMIASSIKNNLLKNKPLNTFCAYDEFGFNGLENRLLKKALVFVQCYLNSHENLNTGAGLSTLFNYINPVFASVSEEVSLHEVKSSKTNAFYKEYTEAIRLAKLILKKFGYNISNTQEQNSFKTPPFWIDMSKLFELYVLGLLKDSFKNVGAVEYHFGNGSNELDFLLNAPGIQMVVDAKYKPRYKNSWMDTEQHKDIRQVSGYARLEIVYNSFNLDQRMLIDCLIIYPDMEINRFDLKDLNSIKVKVKDYVGIYKVGISLPQISIKTTS